jgi:hypothetical protein
MGKAPAMVAQVQSGSVAERAGVTVGDFVLKVCGRDIRTADGEQVLRMMREEVGKAVEVAVARPYPVPLTDKEKMRALLVLQTKLDSGTIFQPPGGPLLPFSVCNVTGSSMYGHVWYCYVCLHAKLRVNRHRCGDVRLHPVAMFRDSCHLPLILIAKLYLFCVG